MFYQYSVFDTDFWDNGFLTSMIIEGADIEDEFGAYIAGGEL
jgi:hypothetical protein